MCLHMTTTHNLLKSKFRLNVTFNHALTRWNDHNMWQISMNRCCVIDLWSLCFLIRTRHSVDFTTTQHKLSALHCHWISSSSYIHNFGCIWLTYCHLCAQNYRIFLQHSYFTIFSQYTDHEWKWKAKKCALQTQCTQLVWIRDNPCKTIFVPRSTVLL